MTNPTMSQVHIDRAMTRVSIAYRNTSYIAEQVFPVVPVENQSDKYFLFDKESWFRNEAGLRAPGALGPIGEYNMDTAGTYTCQPISFSKLVPDEIVDNADAPLRPRQEAVEFATDKVMLFAEYEVASNVFGSSVWSGSSTPSPTWDDDASDPLTDVEVAREAIVKTIGREPNVMVVGRETFTDLKHHPDLLDRIKYVQKGVMTADLLAGLFEVEKFLVGSAIYDSAAEGATASMGYIWGKHAWLGYVPANPSLMVPAAGYMFTWKNRAVKRYRIDTRESDLVRVEWHYDDKVTSADAGYLLKNAVA